ncbi:hypothetical protein AAMO2058_001219700 [Amorphochlora amoebiformis]
MLTQSAELSSPVILQMTLLLSLILSVLGVRGGPAEGENRVPRGSKRGESQKITFGSCNKPWKPQPLWEKILAEESQAFMWTGDAVYTNGSDIEDLEKAITQQLNHPDYQTLIKSGIEIIGAVDDHDYGVNDAGKDVEKRSERIKAYGEFLHRSNLKSRKDAVDYIKQDGLYSTYTLKENNGERTAKVIMLDSRTQREPYMWHLPSFIMNHRIPVIFRFFGPINTILRLLSSSVQALYQDLTGNDVAGEMLGESQWGWLEDNLRDSDASFHVIISGVQVWTSNPLVESWGHFPRSRKRLAALLEKYKPKGVIFISGDVHFAELISGVTLNETVELTCSGLTHYFFQQYLVGPLGEYVISHYRTHRAKEEDVYTGGINYGLLSFNWNGEDAICGSEPVLNSYVKDHLGNAVLSTQTCAQPSAQDWLSLHNQRRLSIDPISVAIFGVCALLLMTISAIAYYLCCCRRTERKFKEKEN